MVNFDDDYSALLQNAGHLVPFFDSFFGFLFRRTDFFCLKTCDSDVVGFTQGSSEKLLLSVFRRWETHAKHELRNASSLAQAHVPPVANEVDIEDAPQVIPVPDVKGCFNADPENPKSGNLVDESESFNGADLGHYRWSQSSTDLDVTIPVDNSTSKGSEIVVDIKKDSIKVFRKTDLEVLLEGSLYAAVKPGETVWNLIPGKQINLNLEKLVEGWWNKFLQSDPTTLQAQKLQIEQPLEKLTTSDKMAIEEVVFRQKEKMSRQQDLGTLLKEAWDKEGSPFQGKPFDPSVLDQVGD